MPQAKAASRARAARSEMDKKGRTISVRGEKFELPSKIKARLWRRLAEAGDGDPEAIVGVLAEVLGSEQIERFWEIDIDVNGQGIGVALGDLINETVEKIMGEFGTSPGE